MAKKQRDYRTHDALVSALSGVRATGSFATRGTLSQKDSDVDVGLTVKDIGKIQLPLEPEDVDKLKEKSRLAHSGKGVEAMKENKVRHMWEIDASEVSFEKQALWDAWVDKMVVGVKKNFGIAESTKIKADPVELVMYEKGCKFELREDPKQASNHFATLSVSLRSNHQGAAVRVTHADQTKTFNTEDASWGRYQWLAWYTGAIHEVKPVTFGVRLVLKYNLCLTSSPSSHLVYDVNNNTAMEENAKGVLESWTGKPTMLWYMLENKYDKHSLSQKLLTGNDALRISALEAVSSKLQYTLLFGHLKKNIFSGEILMLDREVDLSATTILTMDGKPYCQELAITQNEVAQKRRYLEKADSKKKGLIGVKYWYRDSAILIVPPQNASALKVRRWDAGRDKKNSVTNYMLEQTTKLRETGLQSIDQDTCNILQTLLDDHQELVDMSEEYDPTVKAVYELALPEYLYLSCDELEAIGALALALNWDKTFRECCEQLDSYHELTVLPTALGDWMYRFADASPANFCLKLQRRFDLTVKACDKVVKAYERADEKFDKPSTTPSLNVDYWRRLWYREAISMWCESDSKSLKHFPQLIFVAHVLGDHSITVNAQDWICKYLRYFSTGELNNFLNGLIHGDYSMEIETARHYATIFLDAALGGKITIDTDGSLGPDLVRLGQTLGDPIPPKLLELLRFEGSNLPGIVTFVQEAHKHTCWHQYILPLLSSAIDALRYKKKEKSRWGRLVSEDDIRTDYPWGETSPTVAEIKLLVEFVKETTSEVTLKKLWDKLAHLKELDLDVFAGAMANEELQELKQKRKGVAQ